MKTWYRAVCDEHKSMCDVFVDCPSRTSLYLSDNDEDIYQWLMLHYGCKLRFIHNDIDVSECFDKKYEDVFSPPYKK